MVTKVKERKEIKQVKESKFIDPKELTIEQLTDPDYRLKQIERMNGSHPAVCSKCHHCR